MMEIRRHSLQVKPQAWNSTGMCVNIVALAKRVANQYHKPKTGLW